MSGCNLLIVMGLSALAALMVSVAFAWMYVSLVDRVDRPYEWHEGTGAGGRLDGLRPCSGTRGEAAEASACAPGNLRSPEAGEEEGGTR